MSSRLELLVFLDQNNQNMPIVSYTVCLFLHSHELYELINDKHSVNKFNYHPLYKSTNYSKLLSRFI